MPPAYFIKGFYAVAYLGFQKGEALPSAPSPPLSSLSLPFPALPFSFPPLEVGPPPLPSLPLEVGPLIAARRSGGAL